MLQNCFPWSKKSQNQPENLLQKHLSLCLSLQKIQRSSGTSCLCDPHKHQLQLREGYFMIIDRGESKVLSFFECEPRICILSKEMVTKHFANISDEEQNKSIPMMLRMHEEGKEKEEITFYFDLHQEKPLEYFRILAKTYTTQLDFHNLFQPQRKIGHGLTATVYKVNKKIDNSTVAVKAFKKSVYFASADGRGEESFKRQFKFLLQCQHEGICRLEGVYSTANTIYIVQEYYEKSLSSVLHNHEGLQRKQVLALMQDLLRSVYYLHSKGIFHRDIKLDNIMMRRQGNTYRPVLIDLGMAHRINNENYLFRKCGTPGYVAPEVFKDGATDPKVDVFSLGVIFHILLFRKPVFKGETKEELLFNNRNGIMNLGVEELGDQDELIKDLLFRMLELNPNDRPTVFQALQHPVFTNKVVPSTPETVMGSSSGIISEKIDFYFEEV